MWHTHQAKKQRAALVAQMVVSEVNGLEGNAKGWKDLHNHFQRGKRGLATKIEESTVLGDGLKVTTQVILPCRTGARHLVVGEDFLQGRVNG